MIVNMMDAKAPMRHVLRKRFHENEVSVVEEKCFRARLLLITTGALPKSNESHI